VSQLQASASPITLERSFSFYLQKPDEAGLRECAKSADATVVRGANGPQLVTAIRRGGWDGAVLFDRAGYETDRPLLEPAKWFDSQREAGADRVLTPGRFVEWTGSPDAFDALARIELELAASQPDATAMLAIDYRWLSKGLYGALPVLRGAEVPVALVLAATGDPLSHPQAVDGLIAMTTSIPTLSLLRSDHGAIGAVAFGAAHGSIGLRATYRHFVQPGSRASAIPNDRTPRVFVRQLMDWFSGSNIAGWATARIPMPCNCSCCNGAPLHRFLDERLMLEADEHNRAVLAGVANHVFNAPDEDRRRLFGRLCKDAIDNYGPMGKLSMVTKPKRQLEQWALVV